MKTNTVLLRPKIEWIGGGQNLSMTRNSPATPRFIATKVSHRKELQSKTNRPSHLFFSSDWPRKQDFLARLIQKIIMGKKLCYLQMLFGGWLKSIILLFWRELGNFYRVQYLVSEHTVRNSLGSSILDMVIENNSRP